MTDTIQDHATALEQPLDSLKGKAAKALKDIVPSIEDWTEKVRPEDGTRGRFRWAVETTRPPNVAATAYVLMALERMGIKDRVWTEDDRRAGEEWIRGMHIGDQQYRDPALMDRPSPDWPEDEEWPSDAMLGAINGYARNALEHCVEEMEELPPDSPAPGWPQADDDPAEMLQWVKTRPYDENAWSACSHGMRMATYMLRWHKEGTIPLQPVIDALNFFYSIQDPATGLWGTSDQAKNVRINGTFKLYPLMREALDLPVPHAEKIVDQAMEEFMCPDYDDNVCACDEWDNWYVIALTMDQTDGSRTEDVLKTAAWRIARALAVFRQPDGGLSFHPDNSTTHWLEFDMAPVLPQGDAMGPGVLSAGINVCIDLLGLEEATPWTGEWRLRTKEDKALRERILKGIDLDAG